MIQSNSNIKIFYRSIQFLKKSFLIFLTGFESRKNGSPASPSESAFYSINQFAAYQNKTRVLLRQQHLINHDNSKYKSRNLCRSAHALNMLLSRDKSSASSYAFPFLFFFYLRANCHFSVSTAVFMFSVNTFLPLIWQILMLIRWHFCKMDGHVTLDYLHFFDLKSLLFCFSFLFFS